MLCKSLVVPGGACRRFLSCPCDVARVIRIICNSLRDSAGRRHLSTSARSFSSSSHYDVLGITPKATQNDIKSAYYKLSKIHHPDISSDETSARKFRAISEAYEVLGNVRLKKMYDKGLIVGTENKSRMEYHPEEEPLDPTAKFYKSRMNRNVVPNMDGRTPIYDFDTWSRSHYGDVFARSQYEKELLRKKRFKQNDALRANKQENFIYFLFALGGLFVLLVAHGKEDYDRDSLTKFRLRNEGQKDPDTK